MHTGGMLVLTLVPVEVEDLEEDLTLAGEGAMQENGQTTHKLLHTDLIILHTSRETATHQWMQSGQE